jgi:hypothetical protein
LDEVSKLTAMTGTSRRTIRTATNTDAEKVSVARATTAAAKNGPKWATSPDLQAAAKLWNQASDDMEANATVITGLRSQLAVVEGKQVSLRRSWGAAKRQMLSTADMLCAGSADDLKANGFEVLLRTGLGPVAPPATVHTEPGKALGTVKVSWLIGSGRHGFVLQHATDVSNAATYSALIPVTGTKYTYEGALSGSVVHFRVAAIDPSEAAGCSAFSAWVSGTAR